MESGPLTLDFQGNGEQIDHIAAELAANPEVTVTVDDNLDPTFSSLPCSELWD
ncbi:hypothetical protein [Nocardia sp. NPDC005998]|uniref:hypothetical protein n=1 Tax=Nocardia sp. NPDC005998 TaxID=3156894 RepID=UPI0033B065EC